VDIRGTAQAADAARAAIENLNSSYSEKELELLADYFKRLVNFWEGQRKELILK
jgi:hypothetical protein